MGAGGTGRVISALTGLCFEGEKILFLGLPRTGTSARTQCSNHSSALGRGSVWGPSVHFGVPQQILGSCSAAALAVAWGGLRGV